MIRCTRNNAAQHGEDPLDPRFECQVEAVWHILLASDAGLATNERPGHPTPVALCEEHVMDVYSAIAMRHRVEQHCARGSWRLITNECAEWRPTVEG